jgi:hypothetical protein
VIRTDLDFNVEASFFPFPDAHDPSKGLYYVNNIFPVVDGVIFYTKIYNDTIYSFSNEGELTGGVLFDFGSKKLPERFRYDGEKFNTEEDSDRFNYFRETPFKVNQLWIGQMIFEQHNTTFVYDNVSDKYYSYKLDYANILFANSKYIIGWMDIGLYDILEKKPPLNSSAMAVLEEGGHVLCFYHLKQNL